MVPSVAGAISVISRTEQTSSAAVATRLTGRFAADRSVVGIVQSATSCTSSTRQTMTIDLRPTLGGSKVSIAYDIAVQKNCLKS